MEATQTQKKLTQAQKIELFKNCVNVNAVRGDEVFCWFAQEWRVCDGTKCAPSLRGKRASQEW